MATILDIYVLIPLIKFKCGKDKHKTKSKEDKDKLSKVFNVLLFKVSLWSLVMSMNAYFENADLDASMAVFLFGFI